MITLTKHLNGKMKGFVSINTSPMVNPFCQKMMKNQSVICSKCYNIRYMKCRPNLKRPYEKNGRILSETILSEKDIPIFNERYVRLHSFGELLNANHLLNFVLIAKRNSNTIFVLWTKRKDIVHKNLKKIPKNLRLVYSSSRVNETSSIPEGFHKVFTVFDKQFVKENNVPINCKKKCMECLICYDPKSKVRIINEKL